MYEDPFNPQQTFFFGVDDDRFIINRINFILSKVDEDSFNPEQIKFVLE